MGCVSGWFVHAAKRGGNRARATRTLSTLAGGSGSGVVLATFTAFGDSVGIGPTVVLNAGVAPVPVTGVVDAVDVEATVGEKLPLASVGLRLEGAVDGGDDGAGVGAGVVTVHAVSSSSSPVTQSSSPSPGHGGTLFHQRQQSIYSQRRDVCMSDMGKDGWQQSFIPS